jgi:hypothetical protein
MSLSGRYDHQVAPAQSKIYQDLELRYLVAPREVVILIVMGVRFAGKSWVAALAASESGFPLVSQAGEYAFPRILNAVRQLQREQRPQFPGIILDNPILSRDLPEVARFFRPRPELWVVDCDIEERLRRGQGLYADTWTAERLASDDANCRAAISAAQNALKSEQPRMVINTGDLACAEKVKSAAARFRGMLP